MQKLSIEQTKKLLQSYNKIRTKIELLNKSIQSRENPYAAIYGDSVSQNVSALPHGSNISDKTQNIALSYEAKDEALKQNVMSEICILYHIIEQIDTAIGSLIPIQQLVLKERYISARLWIEVSGMLREKFQVFSERSAHYIGDKAIENLTDLMCVTQTEFAKAIED